MSEIVNGTTWAGTYVTAVLAAARAFRLAIFNISAGGGVWRMVCIRYFSNHALLPSPFVRDIQDATVHQRIDTMRRRSGKETT